MYDEMDKELESLYKDIRKAFSDMCRVAKLDELNDLSQKTKQLYTALKQRNMEAYISIAKEAYSKIHPLGNVSFITAEWITLNVLKEYNPITEYVYDREVDRKRARYFESLVATGSLQHPTKSAIKYWDKQTEQYAVSIVDKVTMQAYKDLGIEKVQWKTQKDKHVCDYCKSHEDKVYEIASAPNKSHYGCRCYYIPYLKK